MASARPIWLLGPVEGVPALLQPVAHALLEAKEDVEHLLAPLSNEVLWKRSDRAASIGFHVAHAMGSLDRLFTYARGQQLSEAQLTVLAGEKTLDSAAGGSAELTARFGAAVERAIEQLRATDATTLTEAREVGRAKLPSTVLGLLVHAGDHTYRHVGQAITTARFVS